MAKIKMRTCGEVAKACGCSIVTAVKYAQKPENGINFAGTGRRKIYIWFDADVERFAMRAKSRGRPKKGKEP